MNNARHYLAAKFPCQRTDILSIHYLAADVLFWYAGRDTETDEQLYGEQVDMDAGWYCILCRKPGELKWTLADEIYEKNISLERLL